jgi:hypothetical protein
MLAVPGETAIDVTALVAALNCAVPVTSLKEADTVTEPGATAVAIPPAVMVAIAALELVHLADDVTSSVVPLL